MHPLLSRLALVLVVNLSAAAAVAASHPITDCRSLAELRLPNTVIVSAYVVPRQLGGPALYPAAGATPAYCEVKGEIGGRSGVINPDTGSDHYGTQFQLRLPAAWNGRFFYQGGSGSDGLGRFPEAHSVTKDAPA